VIDPSGGGPATPPRSSGRPPWWTVGVLVVLVGLIAVAVAAQLVDGRRETQLLPTTTPVTGSVVPPPELAGEWSGEGSLARCAGFDEGCPATRSVTLTIDCSADPCRVTPFDRSYGSPPLQAADGSDRATGPVPADVAPRCDDVPAHSALWQLDLTVQDGRLVGSYAESTLQSFDCGGTGVAWDVVLDRR